MSWRRQQILLLTRNSAIRPGALLKIPVKVACVLLSRKLTLPATTAATGQVSLAHLPQMASQRLALNLQRSLRSRQALNAVRSPLLRHYANPVTPSSTESTTLSNGFTVWDETLGIAQLG